MKISLIEAGPSRDGLPWSAWSGPDGRFAVPAVGLVSLASLVRDHDEVEIIDEKVSGPADDVQADLAGISFKTMDAARAYALGDSLRARGVKVVMGGLHTSLCPQEAARHADVLVLGEGEPVWRQLLDDVEKGTPRPMYGCPDPRPIDNLPPQRVELVDHTKYLCHGVQTARGCSLDCEFCPTRAMFGEGFRLRTVDAVAGEVEKLLSIERKPVFFTDDVFGAGHMDYIKPLAARLKELAAQYAVICDLRMVNKELIGTLAATGCEMMCFDIFGGGAPEEMQAVKAIQGAGIRVLAYFMLGFEHQGPDVFKRIVDFVRSCDIRHISVVLLTPYAGTQMAKRLEAEGRLLSTNWDEYDQTHVVFTPANMTAEELEKGYRFVLDEIGELYDVAKVMKAVEEGTR